MTARPLVCQQLVELVSDYLDGSLRASDRTRVEAHLELCDACGAYVLQVRRMLELTRSMPQSGLSDEQITRLTRMFRARHPGDE